MFAEYLFRLSSAEYESHILLMDTDDLEAKTKFSEYYAKHSFQIIRYVDDLWFRVLYTDALMDNGRYLVIARSDDYIPYDIYKKFRCMDISLAKLFPKLNAVVLKAEPELNYDLLSMAYQENFADLRTREATQNFLRNVSDVRPTVVMSFAEILSRGILPFVLSSWMGYYGIWWATPVGWTLSMIIGFVRYRSGKWKDKAMVG